MRPPGEFGHRAGDYRTVGHWVAQFGMFALQPLFGDESYRSADSIEASGTRATCPR